MTAKQKKKRVRAMILRHQKRGYQLSPRLNGYLKTNK